MTEKEKGGKKGAGGYAGKRSIYRLKDGHIERSRQQCPKCGPGTFLGVHKDRTSCGKCGYTEFKQAKAAA